MLGLSKKRFQKTVEDFTCEKCEREIEGNGYTNHCPHCLWSKHVDENPGDRAAECGGMMKPVGYFGGKKPALEHECQICGHQKRNKTTKEDKIMSFFPWQ